MKFEEFEKRAEQSYAQVEEVWQIIVECGKEDLYFEPFCELIATLSEVNSDAVYAAGIGARDWLRAAGYPREQWQWLTDVDYSEED